MFPDEADSVLLRVCEPRGLSAFAWMTAQASQTLGADRHIYRDRGNGRNDECRAHGRNA